MKHFEENSIDLEKIEKLVEPAFEELNLYISILKKWQKSINLISNSTIHEIKKRHILDSAQLYFKIPEHAKVLIDMGSGAGFPGLVIAILNQKLSGCLEKIILVESDIKKSIFLKEVIRQLNLSCVSVRNDRLEKIKDIKADLITARALSSIKQLLIYATSFWKENSICLFLKGEHVQEELSEIDSDFDVQLYQNLVEPKGYIVEIKEKKI